MSERKIRKLAQQALYEFRTTSNFTLMATCEFVVDSAVHGKPEITRKERHKLWLRVWGLTDDPDIQKAVEKKVRKYEASQEKVEKVTIDYHPDNTPEQNTATFSDGSQIRVDFPNRITMLPAAHHLEEVWIETFLIKCSVRSPYPLNRVFWFVGIHLSYAMRKYKDFRYRLRNKRRIYGRQK